MSFWAGSRLAVDHGSSRPKITSRKALLMPVAIRIRVGCQSGHRGNVQARHHSSQGCEIWCTALRCGHLERLHGSLCTRRPPRVWTRATRAAVQRPHSRVRRFCSLHPGQFGEVCIAYSRKTGLNAYQPTRVVSGYSLASISKRATWPLWPYSSK